MNRSIAIFFAVINLSISLFLAAKLNIWLDEGYSLQTTSKDLGYALHQAINFELQLPLYFILLNLWRQIDSSILFARLLSILCIILTIIIIPSLSQRYLKEINPGLVTAAIALNPFIIWAAVEIRPYALVILLSALLMLFFFDGYLSEVPNNKAKWWYVLCSVCAVYTLYFLGFLLVANACTLLLLKRWSTLRNYLFGMTVVGIAIGPMVLFLHAQISLHTAQFNQTNNVSLFYAWRSTSSIIIRYIWDIEWIVTQRYTTVSTIFSSILILIIWQIYRKRRLLKFNDIALLTSSVVSMCLFFLAVIVVGKLLVIRHAAGFFVPLTLAGFAIVKIAVVPLFKQVQREKVLLAWTAIVLIFHLTSLYFTYQPMSKEGDYLRVANYIMANEKPDQPILVINAQTQFLLSYYYSGQNKIIPLPKADDFTSYEWNSFILKDEKQIVAALARVPGEHQHIWIVRTYCKIGDIDLNCQILDKFVSKYYSVEIRKKFKSSLLRLLRRKTN